MWKMIALLVAISGPAEPERLQSRDTFPTKEACAAAIPERAAELSAILRIPADVAIWCEPVTQDL